MHECVAVPLKFNPGSLADFASRFASALNNERNKVIVLTGGATCFSMGMDLVYISTAYDASFVSQFAAILKMVRSSHKPVLAKVEGDVIAGGMALLAVADVILASESASFSLPEASFGITPAIAMSCLLERIRPHHLKYLVWNSNVVAAKQALEWGLVDHVSTPENLERDIQVLNRKLSRLVPSVIEESKMLLAERHSFERTLNIGCQLLENKLNDAQAMEKIRRYLEDIRLFNDEYAGD
ncbi:enoyl-CoA hydratase/isomerase family protein [Collimonas fungivorans]|uniref:Enoyl-CoA hydratase/isomerase family protein n=1 Tax=Collimonas fungivorans TaxID=158899 RepID=A0A127PAC6_9BURK|nr:enoyl-CoA hydratase/isomerase family protein [Collimonas fungivorans]AMO94707.1 enoyl-CoA hydratase/isomerase family protein [Collimonas fungivorans]